ncbi:MAG: hypothetical protein VST69_01295 [Nitrospirota bacterium]|nr:hypothetical protein [Nitrospirota bacterium]
MRELTATFFSQAQCFWQCSPRLVAQGRTITETLEIARDVAKKLFEAQAEREEPPRLKQAGESFDDPLVVGG